jgi:pimeloyl-ACP methyl ester carboxylesterase
VPNEPGLSPPWKGCASAGPISGSWRSEDVRNPVLLYLHGGPGTSQLTSNRRNTRHLERYFTVVNRDQRGAGKSYRAIGDAGRMNIGQFVAGTRELTLYLLAKFHQERLILAGHSWGA